MQPAAAGPLSPRHRRCRQPSPNPEKDRIKSNSAGRPNASRSYRDRASRSLTKSSGGLLHVRREMRGTEFACCIRASRIAVSYCRAAADRVGDLARQELPVARCGEELAVIDDDLAA